MKDKHNITIDPKTQCLNLSNAIYGIVQAARQWWKKLKEVLGALGFQPSRADTYHFIQNKDGCKMTYLIIYVGDGGIFTDEQEIQRIITTLSKLFVERI
jgi:hypothetical protein